MIRRLGVAALAVLVLAGVGCRDEAPSGAVPTGRAKPAPRGSAKPRPVSSAKRIYPDDVLPVDADFEEAAGKEITAANYAKALDDEATAIGVDPEALAAIGSAAAASPSAAPSAARPAPPAPSAKP